MQIKTVLLPVAAALSLAACGQPTANSAGSDQKTSADSRGSVSWAKKLGSSKSAKANVSFPAAGMIVQAIYEGEDYATTGNWMRTLAAKYGGDVSDTLYGDDEALNQLIKQLRESLPELAPPAMRPILGAIEAGDEAKAKRLILLSSARAPIAQAFTPFMGWEVDPQTTDFFTGKPKKGAEKALYTYIVGIEASAEYTAVVLADIAGKMSSEVWSDPDAAKAEIRRLWYAQDPAQLDAIWKHKVADAKASGARTIDMVSGRDVSWATSAGPNAGTFYSGKETGEIVQKNGQGWLGDGFIAGKQYQIGLENSVSKAQEKSVGGDSTTAAGTGGVSSGRAQPR